MNIEEFCKLYPNYNKKKLLDLCNKASFLSVDRLEKEGIKRHIFEISIIKNGNFDIKEISKKEYDKIMKSLEQESLNEINYITTNKEFKQ